jgi:hypothetical protein
MRPRALLERVTRIVLFAMVMGVVGSIGIWGDIETGRVSWLALVLMAGISLAGIGIVSPVVRGPLTGSCAGFAAAAGGT